MSLEQLYQKYKAKAEFFLVYIREAHPSDGWQVGANKRDRVIYKEPKTADARAVVAESCLTELKLTMPFLLDDMDNSTEQSYRGSPNRIYVIDLEGKVVMKGRRGPGGVNLPAAEAALKKLLAKPAPAAKQASPEAASTSAPPEQIPAP